MRLKNKALESDRDVWYKLNHKSLHLLRRCMLLLSKRLALLDDKTLHLKEGSGPYVETMPS